MNAIQTALSSHRVRRRLFWLGLVGLVVAVAAVVIRFAGGSDKTSTAPSPGFRPTLVRASHALKNADGVTIRTYAQLDPTTKSTIRTFLATAVQRRHLAASWKVIAPSMKSGYTRRSWSHAKSLPVVPYRMRGTHGVDYAVDYAHTDEILLEVGLAGVSERPETFLLGLTPVGRKGHVRWLVDYWMPRYTPPVPMN